MSRGGGYNGSTVIEFTVERVRDPVTNELRPVKDDDPDDLEVQTIELSIEGASYFTPGVTWKKPEDCYPDEGETRIDKITGPDSKVWDESDLTKAEYESALEEIQSSVQSDDSFDEPDDYDHDYGD